MGEPIDRAFMESLGFLEDGDGNDEMGLTILGEGVTESYGEEPMHQLVWNASDGSLFLEAYSDIYSGGDSLAITELPKPTSREKMVELLKLLGAYRPTLHDHVSRELQAYMHDGAERSGMGLRWFINEHNLVQCCNAFPGEKVELIWSINADEQLGAYMADQVEAELISRTSHCEFDYVTVFRDKSEVIVYGSGSDWMVQYARVTNPGDGWRRWFAHRPDAENYAMQMASKKYEGMHYHRNNVEADPLGG